MVGGLMAQRVRPAGRIGERGGIGGNGRSGGGDNCPIERRRGSDRCGEARN
jgi:hypothetical protein